MDYKYVSIDRVFSKLSRDLTSEFSEGDIIEWCGEALEFIGAIKYYEEAILFADVKNHQIELPKWTHSIIQVARNHCIDSFKNSNICATDVAKSISEEVFQLFTTSKNGLVLNDEEVPYYKSFFDLKCSYNSWCNSSLYSGCYAPVRLSTNTLFNTLVCETHDDCCTGSSARCKDEYTVIRGQTVRFSFKEGAVAIPYTRQVVDDKTGYPLIPDNISYTTAIIKYITLKIAEKEFFAGREGAQARMTIADQQWQWYCGQASNVDKMPYGIDEHQNLLDQRSYLLPRNHQYFGFFGNLNSPEIRRWNDPDGRNNRGGYLYGN